MIRACSIGSSKLKQVVRGVKLRREGFKLETKRRKKRVNHGTWKRFQLTQIDPRENLKLRIRDIRRLDDGRVAFQLELGSRVAKNEVKLRLSLTDLLGEKWRRIAEDSDASRQQRPISPTTEPATGSSGRATVRRPQAVDHRADRYNSA